MPRLSVLGDAAMGAGSAETSINGAVPSTLASSITGDPRWFNNETLVFQVSQTGSTLAPGLSFLDVPTGVVTVIQSAGANRLAAGGDVWADFLAIGDGQVTTSYAATYSGAGLGDVGEDGALATLTSYLTGGITTYDAIGVPQWSDGAKLRFDSPTPVRSGLVAYCNAETGWTLRAMTGTGRVTPYVARMELPFYVVPITLANGDVWVLEQTTVDGGNWLTLRKATENKGYTVAYGVPTFTPDARELSPGLIRVCWSTDPLEPAAALQLIDLTIATGANTTAAVVSSALDWTVGIPLALETIETVGGTGVSAGRQLVSNLMPLHHPLVGSGNTLTKPWVDYFNSLSDGNAKSVIFREAVPKAVQLAAFRAITHGVDTPLYATDAGSVGFESDDLRIVLDPVTQQVLFYMRGGHVPGAPGLDGDDGLTMAIPGPAGPPGAAGPIGPAGSGSSLPGPPGLDGDDATGFLMVPPSVVPQTVSIVFVIDGGGSAITTGVKGFLQIPFAGTILGWTILSSDPAVTSGSIVIDVWKDLYANYPPTVADTITAAAKPTLTTATKATSTTLTGWTTSIAVGDVIGFNVDSITSVTQATIELQVVKA